MRFTSSSEQIDNILVPKLTVTATDDEWDRIKRTSGYAEALTNPAISYSFAGYQDSMTVTFTIDPEHYTLGQRLMQRRLNAMVAVLHKARTEHKLDNTSPELVMTYAPVRKVADEIDLATLDDYRHTEYTRASRKQALSDADTARQRQQRGYPARKYRGR